jgi:hypothetical protein
VHRFAGETGSVIDQRGRLLSAALGFVALHTAPWARRIAYATNLHCAPRLGICHSGRAHSVVNGTGWERTPWHATQRAAWEALGRIRPTKLQ